jgi:two-component system, OmpR family, response regulator
VRLDAAAHVVTVDGAPVELSSREFDELELLLRNRGNVVARGAIEEHVWGGRFSGTSNVVDVFVRRVRRKLGNAASVIEAVRGLGYRIANDHVRSSSR